MNKFDAILEKAVPEYVADLRTANSFGDIAGVFTEAFRLSPSQVPGQDPPKTPDEYKNENSDYGLKVSGIKTREKLNAAAREILARVDKPEDLTDADREVLKQYSGQGGLSQNSVFEYYTPQYVAEGCWDALKAHGFGTGNALDPATGHGMFEATKAKGVIITGCDIDPTGSKIAQLLNPQDKIENKSFEKLCAETDDDSFDAVITNVPFSDVRGDSKWDDRAYQDETHVERYFIIRSIDKVRPGGLCVFIAPPGIVGDKSRAFQRWRLAVSKKAEFLGAHRLPNKVFKAQGANTITDIVVFKKHTKSLLDSIESLPIETLKSTNVVWDEFIQGRYWMGEGKRFIMGTFVPKIKEDPFSRDRVDGDIDDASLKAKLAYRFDSRIDWETLSVAAPIERTYAAGDRQIMNGVEWEFDGATWHKVMDTKTMTTIDAGLYGAADIEALKSLFATPKGCLQLTAEQAFNIFKAFPDLMTPLQRDAIEFAMSQSKPELAEQLWRGSIIGGMIGRLESAIIDGTANDAERIALQEIITAEINHFGHPQNNKSLMITGASARAFGLFSNAVDQKGNFSDLLTGTLDKSGRILEYDSSNPQAILEHLFLREGITNITLDDIKAVHTGTMKLDSLGDLAEIDGIAIDANGILMPMGRFTSGDIYPRLDALRLAMANEADKRILAKWEAQIKGIMQRRKVTAVNDVTFGFQQKWFNRRYIVEFLRESGYKNVTFGNLQDVAQEDPVSGKTQVVRRFVEDWDSPFGEFHGIDEKLFDGQLLKYLNGENITSNDQERIEEYNRRKDDIEERFNAWIKAHPDIDKIGEEYNRRFNGFTPFEYDTSKLELEGVSGNVNLKGYQRAAIRRLSEEGRGFLAFDTGLGKTYSALGMYLYSKQMGRSKRTCIVVPKSVLSNWYHESNKFLASMDDVLFVGIKLKTDRSGNVKREPLFNPDGTPLLDINNNQMYQDGIKDITDSKAIYDQMWKIPQSNYSLVIMSNEKFGMIPLKQENKNKFVDKMVQRHLMSKTKGESIKSGAVEDGEDKTKGKKRSYAEAKSELKTEEKYSDEGTKKKGELPYFEDMGFTDVITDEGHNFKNCMTGGEQSQGIAYISNPTVSQRGVDMNMKMSYLRDTQNGRGAYMLTATPLTNSPMEIFNMLSFVSPESEMERYGVYTADDFVRTFGKIKMVDKLMMTGEVKSKRGLVGFEHLDGLRNLFFKYVNKKDAKDVPDELTLPEQVDSPMNIPLSDEQSNLYAMLKEEAKGSMAPPKKGEKKTSRPVFSILRDMEKVATDIDLFQRTMTFVFKKTDKPKVVKLIDSLPKSVKIKRTPTFGDPYYDDSKEEQKPVEMEIKLEYTENQSKDGYTVVFPEAYEELVVGRLSEVGISEDRVAHPLTPKYAKFVENCKAGFELGGKQLIFTEEKTQHAKIVRILVHHIPALKDAIGIINADEASGDKLQQIADSYNSGKYRFVVCNKKAEVGVNLQKGTTDVHHLTFPWTPASMDQRNGRAVRQGNFASHVRIHLYQSGFDSYKLDLMSRKSKWIDEILHGSAASAENGNVMGIEDIQIMLSDNPEEAKRKIMEQQAEKARKAKEYADRQALITFQKIANNAEYLSRLDQIKADRKASLEEKIPDLEKKIARYRDKGLALPEGDEERKKLGKLLMDAEAQLDRAKSELSNMDAEFQSKRENTEASIKRDRLTLKARAGKEGLPFDERLIDSPDQAIVSLTGRIAAVGDVFECDVKDSWSTDVHKAIVRIKSLSDDRKGVNLEHITGNVKRYYYNVGDFFDELKPVKVSYSEDEIRLKQLLSESQSYDKLCDGTFSKELFQSHYAEIKWARDYYLLLATNGKYYFDTMPEDGAKVVYPEKESEAFKKTVCEAYLNAVRENDTYAAAYTMKAIFGSGYKQVALQYGKTASQSDVMAELERLFQQFIEKETYGKKLKDTSNENIKSVLGNYEFTDVLNEARKMGDNAEEIQSWIYEFTSAKRAEYVEKVKADIAEEKARKEQELKNDPNYKEVPAEVHEAFEKIGITVKTNTGQIIIPGFKGGKGTAVAPFSKWFFQDRAGKSGKLFRVKEILKARYGASFFSNAGGDFNGAWWHLPSKFDLAEIFKVMA